MTVPVTRTRVISNSSGGTKTLYMTGKWVSGGCAEMRFYRPQLTLMFIPN